MQNFADGDKGTTRDKVAEQIGLGSGEQLRKAKMKTARNLRLASAWIGRED